MSRLLSLIITIVLIAASCPVVLADQIFLKNGDRFTGKIVKKEANKIVIETEAAGTVTIKWSEVASVVADEPVNVESEDGKVIKGTIATKDNETFEVETEDGKVEVPRETVKTFRSVEEQTAYEKEQERIENPRFRDFWTGSVDLGFNLEVGNDNSRKLTVNGNAERKTVTGDIKFYGKALEEKKADESGVQVVTDQEYKFGGTYNRNISDRSFLFGAGEYQYDKFESLDIRVIAGGGYGYRLMRSEKNSLDIIGGGAFVVENFSDGTRRRSAEILVGQDLDYQIIKGVHLEEKFVFYTNLTSRGLFSASFDATIVTRLNKWLGWQFRFEDSFDSDPVVNTQKNDFEFTTGLRIGFGRKKQQ